MEKQIHRLLPHRMTEEKEEVIHCIIHCNRIMPMTILSYLGDYNDDLDLTITAGITPPVTSYSAFTNDAVNFSALTLPLSLAGKKSTVSFNDVIDHVMVSNDMVPYYMRQLLIFLLMLPVLFQIMQARLRITTLFSPVIFLKIRSPPM